MNVSYIEIEIGGCMALMCGNDLDVGLYINYVMVSVSFI